MQDKPRFPSNASPAQARDWAIGVSNKFNLSNVQAHILKEVEFYGRRDGICQAAYSSLQYDTRISRSSIQDALDYLCKLKILYRNESLHRTRWYYLNEPPSDRNADLFDNT